MGEIIDGLGEVSSGARQLSSATDEMVATSNAVYSDVIAVSGEIKNSGIRVTHITEFSAIVEEKVAKTAQVFSTIERELERVSEIGQTNVNNVEALDAALRAIRKN
jgi:methyl-accepting chemotaxis protein